MEPLQDYQIKYPSFAEEIQKIDFFNIPEFIKDFTAFQISFSRKKVSILLFGETSSGKTSFANALISIREAPDKSYFFQNELLKLLPMCELLFLGY